MNIKKEITGECWKGGNSKKFVVIHHTGSPKNTTFDQIVRFFKKPDYISVHYVVGRDGEITQLVEENDRAWHAGVSELEGVRELNNHSIGIEVLSDGQDFTDKQRQAVRELVMDIIDRNNIPAKNVLRHADIAPKRKWDIGEAFYKATWGDWAGFQASLASDGQQSKIKALEAQYLRQSVVVNRQLERLNEIRKELALSKGVEYVPHILT